MNIEEQIVNYLVKKYNPQAIFLTGSRAKGYAREDSDWDITLLSKNSTAYIGELFNGQELDMRMKQLSDIKNNILANRWSPYQAVKILYDKSNGRAEKIAQTTMLAYKKGPKKLSKREYEARERFDRRKLKKLIVYQNNQALFLIILRYFSTKLLRIGSN